MLYTLNRRSSVRLSYSRETLAGSDFSVKQAVIFSFSASFVEKSILSTPLKLQFLLNPSKYPTF
jgi:hypothetical protein